MTIPPPPPYDPELPANAADSPLADGSRSWRRDVATAAIIVVLLEIVAVPLGLLWGHVVPHPVYYPSGHQLNLVVGDAKPLVRSDGWFLVITGAAGLVSAVAAYFLARRAEVGATVGLAIGGLAAGWLAWRVGHAWTGGLQPIQLALKPDNTKAALAADLGARTVLLSWAVAAVGLHGLIYALTWPAKAKPQRTAEGVETWSPPVAGAEPGLG